MKQMQSPRTQVVVRRQQAAASAEKSAASSSRAARVRVVPAQATHVQAEPVRHPVELDAPATFSVLPVAGAVNDADPPAGCSTCRFRTTFDNCADPVAAGLTKTFELIGHPREGRGCAAYSPVNEQDGVAYWRIRLPDRFEDLAVCPPEPIESIRQRYPQAVRIEPIAYLDAWPAERAAAGAARRARSVDFD